MGETVSQAIGQHAQLKHFVSAITKINDVIDLVLLCMPRFAHEIVIKELLK